MVLYMISGLGADRRLFQKLRLPYRYVIRHLDWNTPYSGESLPDYALRMAKSINTREEYCIIGLSFGGMIASEIARHLHPKHTIIISSISKYAELPLLYRLAGKLGLNRIVPHILLKPQGTLTNWLFGAKTQEENRMLESVIKDTDPYFVKWAINSILHWPNKPRPANIIHIQGTRDKVLPIRNVAADYKIKGGEHLMIYTRADEISALITKIIG